MATMIAKKFHIIAATAREPGANEQGNNPNLFMGWKSRYCFSAFHDGISHAAGLFIVKAKIKPSIIFHVCFSFFRFKFD